MMESCPMDRCFMCGCTPSHAICESCADGLDEIAGDVPEIDAILADARALAAWCQEDYFTDAPECSKGVKALQDAADALSARIGRLRPTDQEQKDSDLDDAEMTALIERTPLDSAEQQDHDRQTRKFSPPDDEDSDPELPEGYDPSEDLHALRADISRASRDPAYTRVQLYILELQRAAEKPKDLEGAARAMLAEHDAMPGANPGELTWDRLRSAVPAPPEDSPTTCSKCGGTDFVCRENVPQEWPMLRNTGGVSIVFETSGGSTLNYDACHGATVYCSNCGNEEPDVGIEFGEGDPDDETKD